MTGSRERMSGDDANAPLAHFYFGEAHGVRDDVRDARRLALRLAAFHELANALDDHAGAHRLLRGFFEHGQQIVQASSDRI